MLLGIQLKANPTKNQKLTLSQWMGCSRLIWNSKCEEARYYTTFARKYHSMGTYAPIDQTTAQFKSKTLTPQECSNCGYTHSDNRQSQSSFHCGCCGHIDNADRNASLVIKKRAIKLILDTGTVLSARGVLTLSDKGRGAKSKTGIGSPVHASGDEPSKKKRTAATKVAA